MLRAILAVLLAFIALPAQGGEVSVAVAANFTEPAKAIAAAFEKKTGHKAVMSFGPSGAFYAQIQQGAPFEVFLSADAERPTRLEAEGFGVAKTRFVYAYGALVLWSAKPGFIDAKGQVLKTGTFDHIAIADPAAAPYGTAAIETMKKLAVHDALGPKIVKGASIAQAYTFVHTGAAELGFVALSQVKNRPGGSRWIVPKSFYSPIDQQAILLKPGANDPAARAYLDFLKTPQARAIITTYGYEVK
ncbi:MULTISPECIES: molybdate ABC transporter substrate-binding protein [Asticcacaulis]|uniref:molybdate ABC transporter substrate-binding protein n=1 Tax=Asticcacaulis TaxID=76890 RepID=UPI001AE6FA4A|nr:MULTISPECIES: molybdate ABC transporter substrate-binding protein [Asticcacaulis]MBP2161701.1 molybdate transport system substrate-binding protein [Asticcacaulis solisilvae]MDR6802787.1 molybdate transport system substrate-binding protein [Asticcacaulis sp. BE141]